MKGKIATTCVLAMGIFLMFADVVYGRGPGTSGAAFLKIGVGARAAALGESYVAIADEASTLYWNPAGMSNIVGSEVILQHNQWFGQISQEYLGYVLPLGQGQVGVGINYLHMGEIERTLEDVSGNYAGTDGTFKAVDMALEIAYSREVLSGLNLGLGLKGISQRIDVKTARGMAMDLGIYYLTAVKGLSMGIAIQNIGPRIKFIEQQDKLPLNIKAGSALRIKNNLLISVDINKPIDNQLSLNTGMEYAVFKMLFIRLGYNSRNVLYRGLSYGVGFNLGTVDVDYAFVPYGDLGDTHRISLSVNFLR